MLYCKISDGDYIDDIPVDKYYTNERTGENSNQEIGKTKQLEEKKGRFI